MNTDTDFLKSIAEEKAAKGIIVKEDLPDPRIVVEAGRLEKAIIAEIRSIDNFIQRDTFHYDTLNKLVNICDTLFDIHHTISPDTKVVLELLAAIRKVVPSEIAPNLKLPSAFVFLQKRILKERWKEYTQILKQQEVDPKLIHIASIPFKRFIASKEKLYWGDYTWLKGYQSKLDAMDWENADCNSKTEALLSLLIGRDFNHDQFYIHCKKYIIERVAGFSTKKKRLLELSACEKLILQDTQTGMPSYDPRSNTLSTRLLKWVKEETNAVKAGEQDEYISKLGVVWNVETLSLFFKLLWDHKAFRDVTLEVFSQQIAAAFSTKGKEDVKASTIFGRFYVKDIEILKIIEALLVAMLEDVRMYLQ
jgi:hypothetical protein